mmetsp:Transcript_66891/g.149258  ORF Transcript_66891/g.149258 Transcript_66891/m.149258 type:complete len:221 (-) Transcript_66891:5-667(-)
MVDLPKFALCSNAGSRPATHHSLSHSRRSRRAKHTLSGLQPSWIPRIRSRLHTYGAQHGLVALHSNVRYPDCLDLGASACGRVCGPSPTAALHESKARRLPQSYTGGVWTTCQPRPLRVLACRRVGSRSGIRVVRPDCRPPLLNATSRRIRSSGSRGGGGGGGIRRRRYPRWWSRGQWRGPDRDGSHQGGGNACGGQGGFACGWRSEEGASRARPGGEKR